MASVRQLSEFCEFGDTLEAMLRDRLVCGVNDDHIQSRLLAEPELTFAKALQLAQAIETADQDTKDLATSQDFQTIHFNTGKPPRRTQPETNVIVWKVQALSTRSVQLRIYTGESLNVLGQMTVKVKYNQ